jgi:hypothetical protein
MAAPLPKLRLRRGGAVGFFRSLGLCERRWSSGLRVRGAHLTPVGG